MQRKRVTVGNITDAIEAFAPLSLQESYDNAGLQVGFRDRQVDAVMLCLDATEDVLDEAIRRQCAMVVSHHPLIFHGLKSLTGADQVQRIVMKALGSGVAVYSAHTNLDCAWNGVSHEMARMIGLTNLNVLKPLENQPRAGLGVIGDIKPVPKIELLRKVKEKFGVKALRYSSQSPALVVKKAALCGGSGASLIPDAIAAGADIIITGDVKYHDFTTYGQDIIIADIGHYESELCTMNIFSKIIREKYPDLVVYFSEKQSSPITVI
ncbi:MAG: Nif3-like dinuclear metal center hexameric protein [Candidatus Amulumruptor caecigallinarius]|nr:Nif3-like dinuclear metal center hexameric protein [Candidatus Amulumruptor caecigallinarius]